MLCACGKDNEKPVHNVERTLQSLSEATYLCGSHLSYPLTIDSLSESFERLHEAPGEPTRNDGTYVTTDGGTFPDRQSRKHTISA